MLYTPHEIVNWVQENATDVTEAFVDNNHMVDYCTYCGTNMGLQVIWRTSVT